MTKSMLLGKLGTLQLCFSLVWCLNYWDFESKHFLSVLLACSLNAYAVPSHPRISSEHITSSILEKMQCVSSSELSTSSHDLKSTKEEKNWKRLHKPDELESAITHRTIHSGCTMLVMLTFGLSAFTSPLIFVFGNVH